MESNLKSRALRGICDAINMLEDKLDIKVTEYQKKRISVILLEEKVHALEMYPNYPVQYTTHFETKCAYRIVCAQESPHLKQNK